MSDIGSDARLATAEDALAAVLALDEDLLSFDDVFALRVAIQVLKHIRRGMS